jgi:hypothetical protein
MCQFFYIRKCKLMGILSIVFIFLLSSCSMFDPEGSYSINSEMTNEDLAENDCSLQRNSCIDGYQCIAIGSAQFTCQPNDIINSSTGGTQGSNHSNDGGTGSSNDPNDPNDPSRPLDPEVCMPNAEAISILPRSSNHEVWQIYSDLVGIPIDAALFAQWTPLAQVRGFDHMTESRIDAQTLEEQLRTTEAVADMLMNTANLMENCPAPMEQVPSCPLYDNYDAQAQFSDIQGENCWSYLDGDENALSYDTQAQRWMSSTDPGVFVWRTGLHPGISTDVIRRWTAPVDGSVSLQGLINDADPGGGDGISVEIRNAEDVIFQTMIVNGGAAQNYDVSFNVEQNDPVDIIIRRNASNSWDSTGLTAILRFVQVSSSTNFTWSNCGQDIVEHIASRAWRRPLRTEELTDLKVVFDEVLMSAVAVDIADSFNEGLKSTLQAALLSPHVQYKPEFVPDAMRLNEESFRRASRLSLYFRNSFPDEELWAIAATGALTNDELKTQARRLLSTDATRFVESFGGQWLNFRSPIGADETQLAQSMRKESHDVFATILYDHLSPADLIKPGFTIVDGPLAAHYGLDLVDLSAGPTRVDTNERGGLFTQGHFLTSGSSGSDFKRVIHRGIYVLNRTLCSSIPPLDPATLEEIAATAETIDPSLSLADRMELHRDSSARCMGCHSQMDPLGLALEQFDNEGRWRELYTDGSFIDNSFAFNGNSVRNPEELSSFVGESDHYHRCVAEKLFSFGLNRALRLEESCVIDGLSETSHSLHDLAIDAFMTSLELTEIP